MSTTIESLELEIVANSKDAKDGIDKLTQSLTKLKGATKGSLGLSSVKKELDKVASSSKNSASSFTNLFNKIKVGINALGKVRKTLGSFVEKSSEYNEVVNLFGVSMGKYASSAFEYASAVSDIMGIDPAEWMRNQGVFMTLATGFGVAGDRASKMSEQLTQLGYDISSFQNISVEDAMQKLQSGLAGELEPLRRIGYDLSQAKLEATALELGIDKSVSSMTQAEKAQLRYYAIMTQVTQQQGDMARTLEDPANQMRIFKAQLEMTARSIGNIFIPIVQKLLPYGIAITKVIREATDALASMAGYETPEVDDYASYAMSEAAENTSTAMDDATDSAKKLKSYMLGFDELNVINPNTDGAEDVGSAFDFELPEYDFLGGATSEKIDGIIAKIKELIKPITDLVNTTVEWAKELNLEPIINGFKELGSASSTLSKQIFDALGWIYEEIFLPIGKWLIESGYPALLDTISKALKAVTKATEPLIQGIKKIKPVLEPIAKWIGEVLLIVIEGVGSVFEKLGTVFEEKGGKITETIEGIGEIIAVIWGVLKPVLDQIVPWVEYVFDFIGDRLSTEISFIIDVVSGIVEFIAGVFTGDWSRAWSGIVDVFTSLWEHIKNVVALAWEFILNTLSAAWNIIKSALISVGTWFYDIVILPICDFFVGLWETVSGIFVSLWNDIVEVWNTVAKWFDDNIVQPLVSNFNFCRDTVSNAFSTAWETIKSVWNAVTTWFNDTIITPVKTAFQSACDAISGFFSSLWLKIRQGVANAMNGVIGGVESAINWVIRGINNLLGGITKALEWAGDLIGADWGNITLINEVSFNRITVPTYADGGFPEQGQMFIAREAGAEMVGNIGRRTAVANNDQIVSSVAGGVAEANEEQNILLREQNSLLRAILEKDSSVYLDGKNLTNSVEKYQRERGRLVVTGGVL